MLQRLDTSDPHSDARAEFDHALGVSLWVSPLSRKVPQIPIEGPWWWRGEEDATDQFLRGMGMASLD